MSNDKPVFPSNKLEALTLLYLEQHGVKSLTPEDFVDEYYKVYDRIKAQEKKHLSAKPQMIPSF